MPDEDTQHLRSPSATDDPITTTVIPRPRARSKTYRVLCVLASVFFVILLLAAIVVLIVLLIVVGQQPARVVTSCGSVEGKYDSIQKVFTFKGIPFAAPPVKENRWRPTEPLSNRTCWKGIYNADSFKPSCVQLDPVKKTKQGDEDCLYLNIYTPSVDPDTPLPVMVYIHGGYLQWGSASFEGYYPDEQTTNQLGVVFVNIQYRLNAFGFLVSEALPNRTGNYGFLDQIEALRWVQKNIAGFGGDPNQVTIFGQSSGGTSVWALMMSPLAKGLFHRAWMISGSPIFNKTIDDAVKENSWLLQKLILKDACGNNVTEKCLMEISPDKILDAIYPEWDIYTDSLDLPKSGYFEPALCVVDGHIIPEAPFVMWNDSKWRDSYSDVPVIIGSTAQEVDLDPAPGLKILDWEKEDLEHYVHSHLDAFGGSISNQTLTLYPVNQSKGYDPEYSFTTMVSDVRITCGTNLMAELASKALSQPVYRYIVTSFPSKPAHAFGSDFPAKYAFHAWDSYAFFWTFDNIINHPSQSDQGFAKTTQEQILNFVKTGNPKDPKWIQYPNTTALLNKEMKYTGHYHKEQCDFWMSNGFFSYSWIN